MIARRHSAPHQFTRVVGRVHGRVRGQAAKMQAAVRSVLGRYAVDRGSAKAIQPDHGQVERPSLVRALAARMRGSDRTAGRNTVAAAPADDIPA